MEKGVLPSFNADGCLPAADYALTLAQLRESMLVVGPQAEYPDWDRSWRDELVCNLDIMVRQLW